MIEGGLKHEVVTGTRIDTSWFRRHQSPGAGINLGTGINGKVSSSREDQG
jgi:hypothetical protein